MNVLIRCDASSKIGTGHLMRCLTLALALREKGAYIRFVSRLLPCAAKDQLNKSGFEYHDINASGADDFSSDLAHSNWLGVTQLEDAEDTIVSNNEIPWDWIIVDHYALDFRWEEKVSRALKGRVLVIDDLSDRSHNCDIFLNQNIVIDPVKKYHDLLPSKTLQLIGPDFSLLRDEFIAARKNVSKRQVPIKNIFVFMGGVDRTDVTSRVLEALKISSLKNSNIKVVIGQQHPNKIGILKECEILGYQCLIQTNKIASLMAEADFAIGGGGATCWERACLGLPSLIISIAENQIDIAKQVEMSGASIYIGKDEEITTGDLSEYLIQVLSNPQVIGQMSEASLTLCDGTGKWKVAEKIYEAL